MDDATPAGRKRELRRAVLAARAALPPEDRATGDDARTAALLAELRAGSAGLAGARCVTCYLSVGTEPSTSALLAALATAGVRVLLPRLAAGGGLAWAVDDGRPPLPGPRGVPAPVGPPADPVAADVWLVPALAVDRRGVRLGRGGGAYDRCLPDDRPVVALLHPGEVVAALPAEPHDRTVTHLALPAGVSRL